YLRRGRAPRASAPAVVCEFPPCAPPAESASLAALRGPQSPPVHGSTLADRPRLDRAAREGTTRIPGRRTPSNPPSRTRADPQCPRHAGETDWLPRAVAQRRTPVYLYRRLRQPRCAAALRCLRACGSSRDTKPPAQTALFPPRPPCVLPGSSSDHGGVLPKIAPRRARLRCSAPRS